MKSTTDIDISPANGNSSASLPTFPAGDWTVIVPFGMWQHNTLNEAMILVRGALEHGANTVTVQRTVIQPEKSGSGELTGDFERNVGESRDKG